MSSARYDRLIEEHKDAVYRQIFRVCGNYDDTEDVLVETLLAAYQALDNLQDESAMRAWLATIGRRICRRMKKKEALLPLIQLSEDIEAAPVLDPAEDIEAGQLKDCILKSVQELPEAYREVYLLRDIKQLSAKETSERLGISVANLKSRLHRARGMVREKLDQGLCSGF